MGRKFTAVKINIVAVRKGLGVDRIAQRFCGTTGMDTNPAKISVEAAFHRGFAGIG